MSHCQWCADPWRSVLLSLAFAQQGRAIARHYGLAHSTVAAIFTRARRRGCLAHRACKFCGVIVNARQDVCAKKECYNTLHRNYQRQRRHGYVRVEAPFSWPLLPDNPRPSPVMTRPSRKRRRFVLAPPLCPTIGTIAYGRMAA